MNCVLLLQKFSCGRTAGPHNVPVVEGSSQVKMRSLGWVLTHMADVAIKRGFGPRGGHAWRADGVDTL